jgi:hypothetical protein
VVVNFCEHGNEFLSSVEGGDFLELLRDYQFLDK